jgi:superfamily II DNA or RNA helicase
MKYEFEKIDQLLYDYQKEVVNIADKENKGIFIMPTGTGKTFVEAAIIAKDIIDNQHNFCVYVINAPRIMLSYQLLKEVYTFLTSNDFGLNIDAKYMCVHSGHDLDIEDFEKIREDTNIPFSEINSSTSYLEISEEINKAKNLDIPIILFSTYHSSTRIEDARKYSSCKINIILNDEAHHLVSNQFHENINTIKSNKQFFFTATTRDTASIDGQGMNNIAKYGIVLYKMSPRVAIEKGKMLRPRLHYVKNDVMITRENLDKNIGYLINETYREHQHALDGLSPKMMVTVNGYSDMDRFRNSKEYKRLLSVGVNIYLVHSNDEIGNMINGVHYSRLEWLKRLKADGEDMNQKLIVIHYQIITEGIDVPGLTGVLLLRSLEKSSFIQTFGRVARLQKIDKERINNGEIKSYDLDDMIKPYGWIILPSIIAEDNDKIEYLSSLIYSLREFDFNMSEDIIVSERDAVGHRQIEGPDALMLIKIKSPGVAEGLEKLEAEYEDEILASLVSVDEKLDYLKTLY